MNVLTSAEETSIKGAGQLQDQINMLTSITTAKESQSSDALQAFIESSDSEVAQLILSYGERLSEAVSSLKVLLQFFTESLCCDSSIIFNISKTETMFL